MNLTLKQALLNKGSMTTLFFRHQLFMMAKFSTIIIPIKSFASKRVIISYILIKFVERG